MLRYALYVLIFYSFIFVFVKAQEVNVTSQGYYETDIFANTGAEASIGFSVFILLLFLLSVTSFVIFWKYKDYLIAALNGNLQKEEDEQLLPAEQIGANDAKIVSSVTVHDVTDENTYESQIEKESTSSTDMENGSSIAYAESQINNEARQDSSEDKKPQVKITVVNGVPKLVIV